MILAIQILMNIACAMLFFHVGKTKDRGTIIAGFIMFAALITITWIWPLVGVICLLGLMITASFLP